MTKQTLPIIDTPIHDGEMTEEQRKASIQLLDEQLQLQEEKLPF